MTNSLAVLDLRNLLILQIGRNGEIGQNAGWGYVAGTQTAVTTHAASSGFSP